MSREIGEFYWIRALSIMLLFFVHSTLSMTQWPVMKYVQYFMLSNFFFVSGYLLFDDQRRGLAGFAERRFVRLYFPFLVFLLLYRYVFQFPYFNSSASGMAFFYHATLLSVFQQNIVGIYDLHHLWFVPVLIVFMVLLVLLERVNGRLIYQVLTIALIFCVNAFLWSFNSAVTLSETFSLFIINFAVGFWIAKQNRLGIFQDRWFVPAALVSYTLLFLTPEWITLGQYWLRLSALSLIATMACVSLFKRINAPRLVKAIANSTLIIYLIEPQIRYAIGNEFGIDFFAASLPSIAVPMLLRIVVTLFIGFTAQMLFSMAIRKSGELTNKQTARK